MADETTFKNLIADLKKLAGNDADKAFNLLVENLSKLSKAADEGGVSVAGFNSEVEDLLGSLSEEQKSILENIKTFEGYNIAIAEIIKAKKELEIQAKKIEDAQKKLSKAFEDGAKAAESYLGVIGFGSSPGLRRAMASLEEKQKQVEEGNISLGQAFMASAKSLAGFTFAGFNVTRLFESFVGNSIALIGKLDETRAAFVKLGPQFENLTVLTKENRQEVLAYGGDLVKLSSSFQSLATNLNYFNFLSNKQQASLGLLTTGFNNFGTDITKTANILMTGLNASAEETSETLLKMKAAADTLGVSADHLFKSFEAAIPVLARFGSSADEVFLKLESISKMTGLSSSELSGFARKFDTLEGAATAVQRLNANLGITAFSMGEMLELDYAERMQVIRERVNETAGSFENLGAYEQDSFANILGMTNLQAAQFFNETTQAVEDLTRSTLESVMSEEEFAAKSRESQTAIEKLKSSIQALSVASLPLIETMNKLVDAVTVIVLRFSDADEQVASFDRSTRNLASFITGGVIVAGLARLAFVIFRVSRALSAAATAAPAAGAGLGTGLTSMAAGMKAFNAPGVAAGFAKFSLITAVAGGLFAWMAGSAAALALNATSRALDSFSNTLEKLGDIGAGNVINVLRQITREIEAMGRTIEANFKDREAAINFSIATDSLANFAREINDLNSASISTNLTTTIAAVEAVQTAQSQNISQESTPNMTPQSPLDNNAYNVNVRVYLDSDEITSRTVQRVEREIIRNISTSQGV